MLKEIKATLITSRFDTGRKASVVSTDRDSSGK